jgi:hypothetical protein
MVGAFQVVRVALMGCIVLLKHLFHATLSRSTCNALNHTYPVPEVDLGYLFQTFGCLGRTAKGPR